MLVICGTRIRHRHVSIVCVREHFYAHMAKRKRLQCFLSKQRPSRGRLAVRRGLMGTHHRRSRRATLPIVVQVAEKVVAVRHGGGQRHGFARPSLRRFSKGLSSDLEPPAGQGAGPPPGLACWPLAALHTAHPSANPRESRSILPSTHTQLSVTHSS